MHKLLNDSRCRVRRNRRTILQHLKVVNDWTDALESGHSLSIPDLFRLSFFYKDLKNI